METAASAIAFVQAAEICVKLARSFIERIRAYRHANERISELITRIEGIWVKTETQFRALHNVRNHVNERLSRFHEECLRQLVTKLCAANAEVETFTDARTDNPNKPQPFMNRGPVKKLRYTLFESHLQKSIRSLEAWHAIFDPSWFLLTLHKDGTIDDALRNHSATGPHIDTVLAIRTAIQTSQTQAENSGSVFRDGIVSPEQEMLPHSSLAISKLLGNGAQVILDTTTYPEALDRALITTHVRDLARLLSCSRPWTLGLLQCVGVLKKLDSSGKISQFQFIFATPPGPDTTPTSLRILLLQGSISLDTKLVIAKSITRAVLAVHSANFIHKNIRPDTILVFGGSTDQDATAYLVGFERSRPAEANTSLIGDMIWERNLYRHPSRQGIRLEEIYKMQHDIYSLGVCLLEIGIWQSLIVPCNPAVPGKVLHIDEQLRMKNPLQAAWEIKSILCGMAKTLLPSLMGLLYTDIVISCLTCLDPEATNMFANEKDLYDEDGILVGVVFIEKILTRIESLSISPPQSLLASGSGAQGLYP